MGAFLAVWVTISGILFVVGMIGFAVNRFDSYGDEDTATNFVFVAIGGLIWPILLPLGLIALVVLMVLHVLISADAIKEPKWWPW